MGVKGLSGEARLPETTRAARVLDIIQQISAAPEQWTRKALAERYEIGERQIQRDLEAIRYRLHLDLRRRRGGYYFRDLPRLPMLAYSLSEALALLLAAQSAREYGVDSSDLASALGRLESVFPDEFRPLMRELRNDGSRPGEAQDLLLVLHRALAGRRKVRLGYTSVSRGGAVKERVVRPYCLFPRNRSWYLVAYCELREEVRTFKVDRMTAAELTGEHYQLPEEFSLEAAAGSAWGLMWGAAGEPEEVRLEFGPVAGRWVAEEEWHPSQKVEMRGDGSCQVRFRVGVTPEMVRWLMWFGQDVRVLEPAWLRERVAAEHRRAGEALREKR